MGGEEEERDLNLIFEHVDFAMEQILHQRADLFFNQNSIPIKLPTDPSFGKSGRLLNMSKELIISFSVHDCCAHLEAD